MLIDSRQRHFPREQPREFLRPHQDDRRRCRLLPICSDGDQRRLRLEVMRTGNRCKTSKHIQTLVNTNNLPCVDAHARRIYPSSCHVATDHYTCCHTVTHSNAQTYIHRGALFCGRPKQLFMMGNTRHPYRPSPVIVTHRGGGAAWLQTGLFVSGPAFKQLAGHRTT